MKDLMLKEILNLSEEELRDAKLALNVRWDNKTHYDRWKESDPDNREVNYTYPSHFGPRRNYTHLGQIVFGFVQLPSSNKKWLLVTAGKITSLPDHGTCEHQEIERFQGLLGRLVVEFHKGNKYQRYLFKLARYIDEIKVVEILPDDYQDIAFRGLDNVHLTFKELRSILNGEKYADYRNALMSVKGVYCLTDIKTGKLYIGSAYGEQGVAQRWENYINTSTGGNKGLIELYQKEGSSYFEEYFEFTLIEFFGMNTDTKRITDREDYWKRAFSSRNTGYNNN